MKRCVIIGGAEIKNYDIIRGYLKPDDYFVFCDCGLKHMENLKIKPDLIIGDFDSYKNPNLAVETITLPREKDDTDTVFAVKEAEKRGFRDFLLTGVIGGRLDHTLCNVSILYYLKNRGLNGIIVDDYSEMKIVADKTEYIPDTFKFFSVLNISGTAEGITIKNAKYSIENATIRSDYQYGVSNEVLLGLVAEVSVKNGSVLLIKDRV